MASIVGVGTLFEKVLKIHSIFISHFSKSVFNPLDTGRDVRVRSHVRSIYLLTA